MWPCLLTCWELDISYYKLYSYTAINSYEAIKENKNTSYRTIVRNLQTLIEKESLEMCTVYFKKTQARMGTDIYFS
jgi:hypothetical protein